ncbi:MAG TPA: AI-2E family transporter [Polyangiaceae bacterium]|nr:AI-2E family transporter [Polyangiaceae bacterium]
MDRVGDFFRERTARRLLALVLFVGLVVLFRHAFVLIVLFLAFQSGLRGASRAIASRSRLSPKQATSAVVVALLLAMGGAAWAGATRVVHLVLRAKETFPRQVADLEQQPLVQRLREHVPDTNRLIERARDYSESALHFVSAVGHIATAALIALILAVLYTLEEEELREFGKRIDPKTLTGTALRWLRYLADAIRITVQLQVVVAAVNAVTTLPVLLLLGVRHVPALMILVFVSGLVPIVGNIVSGAVLALLAWHVKGWLGVGVFVALTFLLHKIEAYYLNPRLTARHVKLPSFLIVASLVAWEQLLGFAGLFVSFPFLFVASKIRQDFLAEDEEEDAATGAPR